MTQAVMLLSLLALDPPAAALLPSSKAGELQGFPHEKWGI